MNKLTIITINYNNASGLRKTVESVFNQSIKDFEYRVIDGGSTDESVQYLSSKVLDSNGLNFKYISELDKGIYHAMNKGIGMASGEYIHFLNSGDWLVDAFVVDNMLNELNDLHKIGKHPDVLVGNKIMVRPDGKIKKCTNDKKPVTVFTFYRGTIEHTSAYIRRSLFYEYGLYDEQLTIVSDWKWYLQAVGLGNARVAYADCYVSCFDTTGISSTNRELEMKERRQVLEQLLPPGVLKDYDLYSFDIIQMERLKRYLVIYKLVWLVERILFKWDKFDSQYFRWRIVKK